jgi:hypothetical protein
LLLLSFSGVEGVELLSTPTGVEPKEGSCVKHGASEQRPLSKAASMTLKSLLGKYGRKGWSNKEDYRTLYAAGTGDHLEEFSTVRAMMTNAPCVGMEALWLPGVARKLYPLTIERFTNPAPWNLCHDYPLGKVPAHRTGLFGAYQNYFRPTPEGARLGPSVKRRVRGLRGMSAEASSLLSRHP